VYPDTKFAGKIIHCSMADSSLNFPLEINTNSPSNDLKAGMYGTAVLLQNNKRIYDGRGAKCVCRKRKQ
jgi:hypothetical protein